MLAYSGAIIAAGIVVDIIISAVLGAAVYLFGRRRHHTLAIVGCVVTIVVGIALGFIIGILSAIIFVIAIWASSRSRRTTAAV